MNRDHVLQEIYGAIRRANELREPGDLLGCVEETTLYGGGGALDSLGLVSLLLDVEEAVSARGGSNWSLPTRVPCRSGATPSGTCVRWPIT